MSDDKFKKLIAVLIALATVAAAIVTYLQNDASQRDDHANRDTKRYAAEALGRKVSGDARVNYDYNKAYQNWQELDLLASSATERGDDAAAARYTKLRDEIVPLSPLLSAPYFDPTTGETNLAKYEADTYLVEIEALTQKFKAAGSVKNDWDYKANTYILHLTLMAVALFLLGMAVTISGASTRWIFSGTGIVVALVAIGWSALIWAKPVYDLREQGGAIEAYARGTGLEYQDLHEEALAAFDEALSAAPTYADAYTARAGAKAALGDLAAAATDYENARANGDVSANTAGELAWIYYQLGRFDDAIAMNRTALASSPGELWIRFDLGLALLVSGQTDAAQAEYDAGIQDAAKQVADAKAAGAEPPSDLWWSLDADAAVSLDNLTDTLDGIDTVPPPDKIANPDAVRTAAEALIYQLKSAATSLEFTGKLPEGTLAANISEFEFAEPTYNDQGEVTGYGSPSDTFTFGSQSIGVLFDYENMKDGQEVIFKVYIDEEEDPSWRVISPWDLGASGSAEKLISLDYSDNFVLPAGDYVIEMYVDSHLAQRGWFTIEEK
jgi:tetratricopeptide (TPR) repeat protein